MDLQYILDEYSCAAYVVEYVNKTNRGISDLHRQIIQLQSEHPSDDFTQLMKKVCINMINAVEMSSQEAAWYLLRQPMSRCSRSVIFIPTMWPQDRHKTIKRKSQMDEEELDEDSTDIWTSNIIQKYEQRYARYSNICLADFAANYTWNKRQEEYVLKRQPSIIRYVNYKMHENMSDYKREMVTLFYPFQNEHVDILDHLKFNNIFDEYTTMILANLNKFQKIDIDKYLEEYRLQLNAQLEEDNVIANTRNQRALNRPLEQEPNNDDINETNSNNLTAVVRQRTNVMTSEEFCRTMRSTNSQQRDFLLTLLNALITNEPLQVFFTGAAGTGKTFTLKLAKEVVNRFAQTHSTRTNAYVACASTGKVAVAIEGTTVHSAFSISINNTTNNALKRPHMQTYRNAFAGVKVIFIDEVSMIGATNLQKIEARLREISTNFDEFYGGFHIIFCGDLRQLPPVRCSEIFKPPPNSICGALTWQQLKYFNLTQVMRQSDVTFSALLTKIGNGEQLDRNEIQLLESRFKTTEWCAEHLPTAIRLFHDNHQVDHYNVIASTSSGNYLTCTSSDHFTGYANNNELIAMKTALYKKSTTQCGGLPYILYICIGKPYILNVNIDVEDGLVNGAIGTLKFVENDEQDQDIKILWIHFEHEIIGAKLRIKSRPLVASKPDQLHQDWTPIYKRSASIETTSRRKTCKRIQFPISPASALTIHKSQGGTFDTVVFEYDKSQQQQLVYVALSRVTSINGLFLTNKQNNFQFHHHKKNESPSIKILRDELIRLQQYPLLTICNKSRQFFEQPGIKLIFHNIQSINQHMPDIDSDEIMQLADILLLSETWLKNTENIHVNNFTCVSRNARDNIRASGVCILENIRNTITQSYTLVSTNIQSRMYSNEMCAVQIPYKTGKLITVYISPNHSIEDCEVFLSSRLAAYSTNIHLISPTLKKRGFADIPIIIGGDFNIDVNKREHQHFLTFMKNTYNLDLINQISSTTRSTSCIDLVFARYVSNIECLSHISYYSYHKPMLTSIRN